MHWWHNNKTISNIFRICESESVSLWWVDVKLWFWVYCCFSANWCNIKLFYTLKFNTSKWYDLILWCDLCVLINVLRWNKNSTWDLTSSMNNRMNFLCFIVKSCDELMKNCNQNQKCDKNDYIIKTRAEWLWSLTFKVNWRL